ncbi:hypothetical protein CLUG_03001 [Clavispora lusitaniae ATCC 42720]|uniref:Uncharacterized protein n=1 Tax=Clavispora lusitaniae (strain ATCC 42720) TaxID=306902 RepID=C4Y388_CLAL4|nr:uncharacterized protein CLUG_03001 [Clavispora lusitaniae ATCC 42720]EEQ38875.1 hypothetical protein CLUG_03001 [Clavispora lusitaniae ATCC 42720]
MLGLSNVLLSHFISLFLSLSLSHTHAIAFSTWFLVSGFTLVYISSSFCSHSRHARHSSRHSSWHSLRHSSSSSARPQRRLTRLQKLVTEQKVRRYARCGQNSVADHPDGVPHAFERRVHGLARPQINAHYVAVGNLVSARRKRLQRVQACVGTQGFGHHEERLGKRADARLVAATERLGLLQSGVGAHEKRTGARNDSAIFEHIGHGPQAVTDSVLCSLQRMAGQALDENRCRFCVWTFGDVCEFIFANALFVDKPRAAQDGRRQVVDGVSCFAAHDQSQPLHVSALGSAQRQDAVLGQNVKRHRVNTLSVDDHKARVVAEATHLVLQVHNLLQLGVDKSSLRCHQLLASFRRRVEKAQVDLGLLVLQGHVQNQHVGVLDAARHVRVPGAVVQHQSLHQSGVGGISVSHGHDLHHVQVQSVSLVASDRQNGVGDNGRQHTRQFGRHFGRHRTAGHSEQKLAVKRVGHRSECLQVVQHCLARRLEAVHQYAWMDALADKPFSSLQQLAHQKNHGGCSISGDLVLRSGRTCNHHGRWVSDSHFRKQNLAVFGQFERP